MQFPFGFVFYYSYYFLVMSAQDKTPKQRAHMVIHACTKKKKKVSHLKNANCHLYRQCTYTDLLCLFSPFTLATEVVMKIAYPNQPCPHQSKALMMVCCLRPVTRPAPEMTNSYLHCLVRKLLSFVIKN